MAERSNQAKIARLIDLVKFIQDNQQVTAETLADQFSISKKTVYQDIRELNAVGIPIYFSSSGLQILPTFSYSAHHFSMEESVLISMGLAMLVKNGTVDQAKYEMLRAKIVDPGVEPAEEEMSKIAARSQSPVANVVDANILALVHEAVHHKRCIWMKYRSLGQKKAEQRELSPYTIIYRKDSWYVIGYCHRHDEIRTFKISRIEIIDFSDRSFYLDEDFDADEFLLYRWFIMGGDPHVVIVRFDQEIGPLLLEKRVANGTVWEEGDTVYLQVLVANLEEFSWWIMQYGEHAEVMQPRELRRILAKRCAKMAAMYAKTLTIRSRRIKQ